MGSLPPGVISARISLIIAAVLWSLGSVFTRVLTEPTSLGLHTPSITPLQIAFFRGLFAGLVLLPLVRPTHIRFRPAMGGMVACFGIMSGLYMSALALGPAANAILLQNTAPFWVYLIGVYYLGEVSDVRSWRAILVGMTGALVIVVGNWPRGLNVAEESAQIQILVMATGSGLMYAFVVLFLRYLREEASAWLTAMNLIGSAGLIASFVLVREGLDGLGSWLTSPSGPQLAFLIVFGAVQMAAPYFLFARGLRSVSPQEAGIITLLEPVLNPIWAFLLVPEKETPTLWTYLGGLLLLGALAWRYFPRRSQSITRAVPPESEPDPSHGSPG